MSYFDQVEVNQWIGPSFIHCMNQNQYWKDFEGVGLSGIGRGQQVHLIWIKTWLNGVPRSPAGHINQPGTSMVHFWTILSPWKAIIWPFPAKSARIKMHVSTLRANISETCGSILTISFSVNPYVYWEEPKLVWVAHTTVLRGYYQLNKCSDFISTPGITVHFITVHSFKNAACSSGSF